MMSPKRCSFLALTFTCLFLFETPFLNLKLRLLFQYNAPRESTNKSRLLNRCEQYLPINYYHIHDSHVRKLLSELNTIEGLLDRAIAGLGQDQPVRKVH